MRYFSKRAVDRLLPSLISLPSLYSNQFVNAIDVMQSEQIITAGETWMAMRQIGYQ